MAATDLPHAAAVAGTVALAYTAALGVSGDERVAEDMVDLCHSLYSTQESGLAVLSSWWQHWHQADRPISKLPATPESDGEEANDKGDGHRRLPLQQHAPQQEHLLLLPDEADVRARRFLLSSTTYFCCDALLIAAQLLRGRRPHLWAGRLAHHTIQLCANMPALRCSPPAARAVRTYLCCAYLAEASTVFLRLRGLTKGAGTAGYVLTDAKCPSYSPPPIPPVDPNMLTPHRSGWPRTQQALLKALVLSFLASRTLNFPAVRPSGARTSNCVLVGCARAVGSPMRPAPS